MSVGVKERLSRVVAGRLPSLDVMRGLIIVLMAIDHARGFVAKNHPGEFWGAPLPVYGGDALAFLTRLVTHLCAPGFMFLMGAGIALLAVSRTEAGWSTGRIVRHLAVRGVVLIVLGQVLENGASFWGFANATRSENYGVRVPGGDGTFPSLMFGVLYALGAVLAIGGTMIRLRAASLLAIAAVCVFVAEWIMPSAAQAGTRFHPLLRLSFIAGQSGPALVVYPALGWLPCALVGMAFGQSLLRNRKRAFQRLALGGLAFLALFSVLRLAGDFGNLTPPQPGLIGFFNMVKYPPSLTFLLFTLGVDFLLLAVIERWRLADLAINRPLEVFGAVPFFFFVTHLWLYAAIGRFFPAGVTILEMYPFWLLGLALLYLPCRWYGEFKQRRPPNSLFRML
jgi:uncharacterized membrane protein